MTVDEIVERFLTQPITRPRVEKLVQLCKRMRVDLDAVLAKLPPEDLEQVRALL